MLIKRVIVTVLALSVMLVFSACGTSNVNSQRETEPKSNSMQSSIPDLTGNWNQSNPNSKETYQSAVISGDTIEVYWITDGGNTKALYWAGTYVAPTADNKYSWDSVNNKEKTKTSLLASSDETKTFTYEDGVISYSVSAMGMTQTVKLEKK